MILWVDDAITDRLPADFLVQFRLTCLFTRLSVDFEIPVAATILIVLPPAIIRGLALFHFPWLILKGIL